ncbi:hypothetical protein HG536_0H00110 [Torulaspora globosa]|uniref:Uncharacterized protein n=1 Tax=Torulaspora globosa TaxID=48254 RepID=A0A7G3ZMA1_9SACH|nr:uncharacterized protein HG536_0H00110 [Torulaspora globosa]QLL34637.1 hypothetical protein HG536_0H00110 [Torulaspora globosa]
MDGVTSDHLFYFIVVLGQMQINVLRGSSRTICDTMDPQSAKLMEHMSAERTRIALLTYIFLDSNSGDLINYYTFSKYLTRFPKGERESVTFQELRQGLIALIREYVDKSAGEVQHTWQSLTHEVMANHSVRTAYSTYAVDNFSLSSVAGSKAIQLQEEASRRWIAWLQLENCAPAQEEVAAPAAEMPVLSYEHPVEPKSFDDLPVAGENCLDRSSNSGTVHRRTCATRFI